MTRAPSPSLRAPGLKGAAESVVFRGTASAKGEDGDRGLRPGARLRLPADCHGRGRERGDENSPLPGPRTASLSRPGGSRHETAAPRLDCRPRCELLQRGPRPRPPRLQRVAGAALVCSYRAPGNTTGGGTSCGVERTAGSSGPVVARSRPDATGSCSAAAPSHSGARAEKEEDVRRKPAATQPDLTPPSIQAP